MKTRPFACCRTVRHLLSVLLILGLATALWPAPVAQARTQPYAEQRDILAFSMPVTLSDLAGAGGESSIGVTSGQTKAPQAQPGVYLYTITLPPDTAVVMGEHRAVLPFTVGNVPTSTTAIDSVQIGLDASIYWINEATSAPPGWQVTQIKNAGGGQAWVQFDVGPSGAPIPIGGELTFELIVSGSRFGVFPTANTDESDALNFSYVSVEGGGQTFALSGQAPSWPRRGLSATFSASPSSLGVGDLITLIMEVTNYSAITQTGIIPSTPTVIGSGDATPTSGPTPGTLSLAPGQTQSFTWVYTAAASGEVVFSASATNTVVYTALEQTEPIYIGNLTAVLELEDTQVISGQLATVNMRVQNNGDSPVLDVVPSALNTLGTATAVLTSGPEPPIVPYLDAGATASFRWAYAIAGNVGATYAFSGTASVEGEIASNTATSAQGEVARYLATVTPRYAVIGTTNQTLVFEVTNGGAEAVSAIDFTIPSGFAYTAGNASGGYGGDWTIVQDGGGNPQYIGFSAPASQELPVGSTVTFTITFDALPAAPAEYSFAVRVEDTEGLAEYVEAFLTVTAYDVTVDAAPTSGLYADGRSTSIITATVTSGSVPQADKEVQFETTVGVLTAATANTDASGVATTTLVAPHSNLATSATVIARSNGAQDAVVITYLGSYELTVYTDGNGDVTREPHLAGYIPGEEVTLTADPDDGWSFSGWSGDLGGTTNPITITMDGPKVVTATFTQDQYALTLDTVGGGSAEADPPQSTYLFGDVVTVTATADPGWTFSGWSGDLVSSESTTAISITADTVITATFLQEAYPLTTTAVGGGAIELNPDQASYAPGTVVTVTADADDGWSFAGWSGDLGGTMISTTITMDGPKAITATFTQDQYTLILSAVGDGSVIPDPNQPAYVYGDVVTVTAVLSDGWSFAGWSGDLNGMANPATIVITGNMAIAGTFTQDEYTLTVGWVGNGSVSYVPNKATYHYGDVITLNATPDPNWSFSQWYSGPTGSTNPATITIQGNTTVGARFTPNEYSLTVGIIGTGDVTREPDQLTYQYGDVVTVTAVPTTGWTFAGWSGDLSGMALVETVSIEGDTAITATFQSSAPVGPFTSLTLSPDEDTIVVGESIAYTAMVTSTYGTWDVSADATFSIETGAGGSWTDNGVYQAGNVGEWTVTVEYGGLTDTATLNVGQMKLYLPVVFRLYGP